MRNPFRKLIRFISGGVEVHPQTISIPAPDAEGNVDLSAAGSQVSDVAYNAGTWDGVTATAPSKNASRDKFVSVDAAIALKADISPTIRQITGATGTITQADNGTIIYANRISGQVLTIDGDIAAGFNCLVIQANTGQTEFADDEATLVNRQGHTKIAGQHGVASLVCHTANTVVLAGDTAA